MNHPKNCPSPAFFDLLSEVNKKYVTLPPPEKRKQESTKLSPEEFRRSVAEIGGYHGPPWAEDRRKKPLRDKMQVQRVLAQMRRRVVTHLRLQGWTFRKIGEFIGTSHVAAWKLWKQVEDDFANESACYHRGLRILEREMHEALRQ